MCQSNTKEVGLYKNIGIFNYRVFVQKSSFKFLLFEIELNAQTVVKLTFSTRSNYSNPRNFSVYERQVFPISFEWFTKEIAKPSVINDKVL